VRLFVAIVPPPAALAELEAAVAPWRGSWPQLRWSGPESRHLTLAFLGETSDAILLDLTTRLARAASRHPAAELAIAGAGAFPARRKARILWAGISGDRRGLAALSASVSAGARRAGAAPPDEGRAYRPHLTLARSRDPADLSALTAALASLRGRPWTADGLSLIRSQLAPGGARYEELGRWPLRPPGAGSTEGPARPRGRTGPPG
jgi:2'-5' RNA ligase